jgi:hypothetical protein
MKNLAPLSAFGILSALLVTVSVWANESNLPTLYECNFGKNEVNYATTSETGASSFRIRFPGDRKPVDVAGDSIKVEKTVIGSLVSVQTSISPDAESTYYSILIPQVNLSKKLARAAFDSTLIFSVVRTSIAGPNGVEGVVQKNQTTAGRCTATSTAF